MRMTPTSLPFPSRRRCSVPRTSSHDAPNGSVRLPVESRPMTAEEIWKEPVRGGYADVSFLGFDGMERMRASLGGVGVAPPIHHLTGVRPTGGEPGSAVFTMPASPWWQTPAGGVTPPAT